MCDSQRTAKKQAPSLRILVFRFCGDWLQVMRLMQWNSRHSLSNKMPAERESNERDVYSDKLLTSQCKERLGCPDKQLSPTLNRPANATNITIYALARR